MALTEQLSEADRSLGLWDATGVGVGAIVGGGILALAGAAFAATGPSAVLAFALNGFIALLTAMSFAEVSSKFPLSGGTYTFAKKVLSVEAAFTVGWVVWFASIVAAALYALGFSQFVLMGLRQFGPATTAPRWLESRWAVDGLALAATAFYALALTRRRAGGGQWINGGKLIVFAVLVGSGFWAVRDRTVVELSDSLRPFFAEQAGGLFRAMGFSFIAMQGFDLIAAVAGEVREPERTIPRAMLGSLGIALVIYLPLLLLVATVGMAPGQHVTEVSRRHPETLVAIAAGQYLGPFGYWLVVVAGVLSMLSALQANLFAASRVALAMARDRTLARGLARLSGPQRIPVAAVLATTVIVAGVSLLLSDVTVAGAASSLIFLVTFALAHWIAVLVRQRSGASPPPFRTPWFPAVPLIGGVACLALAIFQGIAVPKAGLLSVGWLGVGGVLFLSLFARRARIMDATNTALDPELVRMRGRSPLVVVPIANPDTARSLVAVADALAPPHVGRVMLLSVVSVPDTSRLLSDPQPLQRTQQLLARALEASVEIGLRPEALTTMAPEPWPEIARVAKVHRCESLLLGLSQLTDPTAGVTLDLLMNLVDCEIVVLRSPRDWRLSSVRRILVPTAGRGEHSNLLARLLASLSRGEQRHVTALRVMARATSDAQRIAAQRGLRRWTRDVWHGEAAVEVQLSDSAAEEVARRAAEVDLVILGTQRAGGRRLFGSFVTQIAQSTDVPLLLISRRA